MPTTRRKAADAAAGGAPTSFKSVLPSPNNPVPIISRFEQSDLLSIDHILSAHSIPWENESIIAHTYLNDPHPNVVRYRDLVEPIPETDPSEQSPQPPPEPSLDITSTLADLLLVYTCDSLPGRRYNVGTFAWWNMVKGLEVNVDEQTKKHTLRVGSGELQRIFGFFGLQEKMTTKVWNPNRKDKAPDVLLPWILPITSSSGPALVVLPSFQAKAWTTRTVPVTLITFEPITGDGFLTFGASIATLIRILACWLDAEFFATPFRPIPSGFLLNHRTQMIPICNEDESFPAWKAAAGSRPNLAYSLLALSIASQPFSCWQALWDKEEERPADWLTSVRHSLRRILLMDTEPDPQLPNGILDHTLSLSQELVLLLRLQGHAGVPDLKLPALATSDDDVFSDDTHVHRFPVPLLGLVRQKNKKWLDEGAGWGLRTLLGSMFLPEDERTKLGIGEGLLEKYMKGGGEKKVWELFDRVKIYLSELVVNARPTAKVGDPVIFHYPDHQNFRIEKFTRSLLVEHLLRNTYTPQHLAALTHVLRLKSDEGPEKVAFLHPELVSRLRDETVDLNEIKEALLALGYERKEALVLVDYLPWGKQIQMPAIKQLPPAIPPQPSFPWIGAGLFNRPGTSTQNGQAESRIDSPANSVSSSVDNAPSGNTSPPSTGTPPSLIPGATAKAGQKGVKVKKDGVQSRKITPVIPTSHAIVILHPLSLFELEPDPRKQFSFGWTHPYIHFQKTMQLPDPEDLLNTKLILKRFLQASELAAPDVLEKLQPGISPFDKRKIMNGLHSKLMGRMTTFALTFRSTAFGKGHDEGNMQTGDTTIGHAAMMLKSSYGVLSPILLELYRLNRARHEVVTLPQFGMDRMTPMMMAALNSFAIAFASMYWNAELIQTSMYNNGMWLGMKTWDQDLFKKSLKLFATAEPDDLVDFQMPLFEGEGTAAEAKMLSCLYWIIPEKDKERWTTNKRADNWRKDRLAKITEWTAGLKEGTLAA